MINLFVFTAIINNYGEINQKCDLAIASFTIRCRNPAQPQDKQFSLKSREFFGYILTASEKTFPIDSNSIIHSELRAQSNNHNRKL